MSNRIIPSVEPSSYGTPPPQTPQPPQLPFNRQDRTINGKLWICVPHATNIRRGSKISRIWEHGGEYRDSQDLDGASSWICDLDNAIVSMKGRQGTSNASRHLLNKHGIRVKRTASEISGDSDKEEDNESDTSQPRQPQPRQSQPRQQEFRSLVTTVDIERFRGLLVKWVVQCQVPFSAVTHEQFKAILLCLQPHIERYLLRSSTTMTSWVRTAYEEARISLKSQLALSKSRIHFSFNI